MSDPNSAPSAGATLTLNFEAEVLTLTLGGRLDAEATGQIWSRAVEAVERAKPSQLVLEASRLDYCDGAGLGLLLHLKLLQQRSGAETEIRGLAGEFESLLKSHDPADFSDPLADRSARSSLPTEVGRTTTAILYDLYQLVGFVGELSVVLVRSLLHPRSVRWKDVFRTAERSGVDALPIIALITFLIGLIMAFQSAIPMKTYGAEMFVADLVALSIVKELGPLMTAILLAGRSGSAFAAEIGTMKVNEEVSALRTMGLDPVRFLVVPRVIAIVFMTPLLAALANLFGLLGGLVVFLSFGFPLVTYYQRVTDILSASAWLSGLGKAFVFGLVVAAVGCMRGLQTGSGAAAVGAATTRSVVTGIVLIIVCDGVFSVMFYTLGI